MPENNQQKMPPPNIPDNVPHEEKLNPDIVQQKKSRFFKRIKIGLLIVGALIALVILIFLGTYIYNKTKKSYVTTTQPEPIDSTEVIIVEPEPEPEEESWDQYSSSQYKFSVEFPMEDTLEIDEERQKEYFLKIGYQDNVPAENTTGDNLVKGYLVTINPLQVSVRDENTAAETKRESFILNCPDSAYVSKVADRQVDNIAGKGFSVSRCNSNYEVYYIPADEHIFEIILIYKGDLGFEQTYKSQVNLIRNSIKINLNSEDLGPYKTFEHRYVGISFAYHRNLDTECCEVAQPPVERVQKLIAIAENSNNNALGVFSKSAGRNNLDNFVSEQKQVLIDDYKVVKGVDPQGKEAEIDLNGHRAIKLTGYSWKGNDLIYTYAPKSRNFIIFSVNGLGEEYINHIFNTYAILER